ncbi:ABC transporter ATP-binding protein [Devosia ginsengisoli]|uniref:sn-glycerol-3-phosphate ABC transporter ATP-binding protein UgpC n=1 Tax=Devosia ginsengisoli TaxID=400770 RepID=A0A5B8LU79_9HYPH|nr:sn-glycerol-3-phosphate ABC transporter ATP-binding protein UgpC [Devosia ginsengisoli]QDZ11361.1 sn-glycerol-3-phosphate ABC transporter ATP-binding protein UgpC [Devosia ginsengisoli]
MSDIRIDNVTKSYGNVEVIPGLSLALAGGSFTVLLGPSGCGKSTLLRMIAGLEEVTSGAVFIDGVDVTDNEPSERGIAMVFQSYALYPHMTVYDNMAYGLKIARMPKPQIEERVRGAAAILQLTDYLKRKPAELSGGQRQRVAIGRAIVRDPKVFLFDEPLSNLDAALRNQMRIELAQLHARLGATMVYVTHDQVEAMTMADTIVVLNKGSIEQTGEPLDLYNKPASIFVAEFIGSPKMNIFGGDVAAKAGATHLGVRPENLVIGDGPDAWPLTVTYVEKLGADTIVHADGGALGPVILRAEGTYLAAQGQTIHVTPQPEHVHLFDAAGKRIN